MLSSRLFSIKHYGLHILHLKEGTKSASLRPQQKVMANKDRRINNIAGQVLAALGDGLVFDLDHAGASS